MSRSAVTTDLLPAPLLARLERMQLRERRSLVGSLQGAHRSPRYGTSLDFADYRPYVAGDDTRRIDENLLARLNVLALKLFDAEDDLIVRLVLDTSASMAVDQKLDRACELAGALGFVGLTHRDTVRLQTLSELTVANRTVRRYSGRAASAQLFRDLHGFEADGPTPLVSGLRSLLSMSGPPGLTIVLSDLLTPEWTTALRSLPPRKGAALIVHVLGPSDVAPELTGDQELIDSETSQRIAVSLDDKARAAFATDATNWMTHIRTRCAAAGVGYKFVRTDDSLDRAVLGLFGAGSKPKAGT